MTVRSQVSTRPQLLVVDDDASLLDVISRFGRDAGFDVQSCAGGGDALARLKQTGADLAIVDLRMPDVNGLDVLRVIRETVPSCEVILMTGYAAISSAVEAIKLGAIDYLTKPLDFKRLTDVLNDVRAEAERRRSLMEIEGDVARRLEFCGMLGRSPAMHETFTMIRRLAPHVRTILITGETGTGKELAARALHRLGPRRDRRFVPVNCSAVVETLFESELFGHVRGAFTGAVESKAGMFELADGGTLFLDEIGELPLSVQAKLLRTLETGDVQRVGSVEARRVDVHIFAATNRDLRAEIAGGRFRADLFYRLNVVDLRLPALRERREDVPYLTAAFVREYASRLGKSLNGVSAAAERVLSAAPWDGNVRELRNVIERACILADGELITERDLSSNILAAFAANHVPAPIFEATSVQTPSPMMPEALSVLERDHILRVLRRANGNKKMAAQLLGVSRRALYRRLERHNLQDTISPRKVLALAS